MDFDYIIKMENMKEEMWPIIQRLVSNHTTIEKLAEKIVPTNKSPKSSSAYSDSKSNGKSSSNDKKQVLNKKSRVSDISALAPEMLELNSEQQLKLENMYKRDSELFQYEYESKSGKVSLGLEEERCEKN